MTSTPSGSSPHGLETILERLERAEAEIAELRRQAADRSELSQRSELSTTSTSISRVDPGPVDRRRFVTRSAAAAAAGAVAAIGAPMAMAAPAAAADGDALISGGVNAATTRTALQLVGALEYGFGVHEQGLSAFETTGKPSLAAHAHVNHTIAVYAMARGAATGVVADAAEGRGVAASSSAQSGLHGSTSATEVHSDIAGVRGLAPGGAFAGSFTGPRPLYLAQSIGRPQPPLDSLASAAGQITGHTTQQFTSELWHCTTNGTPGTWRKLSGADTAGAFHVLPASIRVYDSRAGEAPLAVAKGKLQSDPPRVVDATVGGAVPVGATAAVVNLTVVNTSAGGFLSLFKNGIAWPGTSTINWSGAGTVIANSAVVALDSQARLAVKVAAGSSTDFIIDVVGYYR